MQGTGRIEAAHGDELGAGRHISDLVRFSGTMLTLLKQVLQPFHAMRRQWGKVQGSQWCCPE